MKITINMPEGSMCNDCVYLKEKKKPNNENYYLCRLFDIIQMEGPYRNVRCANLQINYKEFEEAKNESK